MKANEVTLLKEIRSRDKKYREIADKLKNKLDPDGDICEDSALYWFTVGKISALFEAGELIDGFLIKD